RTLIATTRPRRVSSARHTSPMPPAPTRAIRRYAPRCWSGASTEGILSLSVRLVARKDAPDRRDAGLDGEKNSPVTYANPKHRWLVSCELPDATLVFAQPTYCINDASPDLGIEPAEVFASARPPLDQILHARNCRTISSCGIEGSSSSPSRSEGSNGSSSIGTFASRTV